MDQVTVAISSLDPAVQAMIYLFVALLAVAFIAWFVDVHLDR